MASLAELGRALVRRREWLWAPLLMAFVAFWLHRTVWTRDLWLGRESLESFWPNLSYLSGALARGEWPLWNPYDRAGYAFAADPHAGLYYPVTWLFAGVGALAGGMPGWSIQVLAVLHLAIAGTNLHAFLRSRALPAPAAALGGVVLMTSMPWLIHLGAGVCWPLAWAPLVWIASDRMIERARTPGTWRRGAALGAALGLAAAAGAPAGFFYTLLVALVYGAWRLVVTVAEAPRKRAELLAQARGLGVAAGVTVALALVIVVPAFEAAAGSLSDPAAAAAAHRALKPALAVGATLAGLVSAPGGQFDAYVGLGTLLLVIVALGTWPRADRGAPILFAALGVLAALLAFGANTPVLPWLAANLPGFGLFREPMRYATILALATAVLAAHGAAALLDEEAWMRRRALVLLGAAVLALALGLVVLRAYSAGAGPFVALGVGGALLTAVALAPARFRPAILAAAVGAIVLDVGTFAARLEATRELAVDDQEDRRPLAELGDVEVGWRVYDEFLLEQRAGSRLRIRELRGNPMGEPLEDVRQIELRQRFLLAPQLVGAYNVRWVLSGPHHRLERTRNRFPAAATHMRPQFFRKLASGRYEVVGAAPLVLWYGGVMLSDRQRALDHVAMQEAAPGVRRLAVVEQADVPAGARAELARLGAGERVREAPVPVPGEVVSYGANRVVVRVDAPAEGLVVLNEAFAPGWRVRVDGRAATPVRTNYVLRGVVVPAGVHELVWTFAPTDYWAWLALWGAAVAFVLAAAVSAVRSGAQQLDEREPGGDQDDERDQDR